jgi:serine protease Do
MSNTPFRKLAFTIVVSTTTVCAATMGLRAFSDVPKGMPFTAAQSAQLASPPTSSNKRASLTSDQEFLGRASHAFNEIAQTAMPSVVSISTLRRIPSHQGAAAGMGMPALPSAPDTLPRAPRGAQREGAGAGADARMIGIGSGIIIRRDGLVLTNNHVVENAERVTVTFDEKHKMKAHVVGTDPKTDLAVVQLDGPKKDYPVISFGNSDLIREGDWAIAIGSPFGLNRSVSFGIISAKGRAQMGILDTEDFIQTDAAINPGSSGGPLLNSSGDLVGVNTAIFSQGGGNMGIGFAIPAKIAKEVSDELITHGRVSRGWAGLMAQDLDADLAKFFKVPVQQGALVSEVVASGPAGRADLQSGDVVTRFDSQLIDGASTLKSVVGKTKPGSSVAVQIVRGGKPQTLTLAIQEQPGPRPIFAEQAGQLAVANTQKKPSHPEIGVTVEDVPMEISKFLHIPAKKGTLVISVNPGSPAFDAGIGPGDIILSADRTDVHGAREFGKITREMGDKDIAVLYVQRGPMERVYVPIKLKDNET